METRISNKMFDELSFAMFMAVAYGLRPISGGADEPVEEKKPTDEGVDAFLKELDDLDAAPIPTEEVVEEKPTETERPAEEVVVVDDKPAATAPTGATDRSALPEDVRAALSRLDRYEEAERTSSTRREQVETRQPETIRQAPEMVEVVPGTGFRLPKDASQWPIQVSADMLHSIGWNDDPARAIAILGNWFYQTILSEVPPFTAEVIESARGQRDRQTQRIEGFWSNHKDLKEHESFVQFTEQQLRADPEFAVKHRGDDYNAEVAKAARTGIAKMRGQSYEQYMAGVQSDAQPTPTRTGNVRSISSSPGTPSRASTTSSNGRAGSAGPKKGFDTELSEMEDRS